MNGILNVLKPPGMSSHDVVHFIRRTFKIKKAGHTGTLDPGAAGVLVVCVGAATRLAQYIQDDKEYRAEITLGLETSSGDTFGEVTAERDASYLTEDRFKAVLPAFTGEIKQVPPMTSALKWQGKKLYQLARAGQVVDRPARAVTIFSLQYLEGSGWGGPRPKALLHLACSKGTYVRSLCADIGTSLGYGAHMSFLVRTRAGPFTISEARTLEELAAVAAVGNPADFLVSMEDALPDLPAVVLKPGAVRAVSSGAALYMPGVDSLPGELSAGKLVRLVGPAGLLAVAEAVLDPDDSKRFIFKPVCVLFTPESSG